jgi:hypothetical protein
MLELGRRRQENQELKASLGYTARTCSKKKVLSAIVWI